MERPATKRWVAKSWFRCKSVSIVFLVGLLSHLQVGWMALLADGVLQRLDRFAKSVPFRLSTPAVPGATHEDRCAPDRGNAPSEGAPLT
jgi:hypothetical protein